MSPLQGAELEHAPVADSTDHLQGPTEAWVLEEGDASGLNADLVREL